MFVYRELNMTYLKDLGVEMLPDYLDPYHKRLMTFYSDFSSHFVVCLFIIIIIIMKDCNLLLCV